MCIKVSASRSSQQTKTESYQNIWIFESIDFIFM